MKVSAHNQVLHPFRTDAGWKAVFKIQFLLPYGDPSPSIQVVKLDFFLGKLKIAKTALPVSICVERSGRAVACGMADILSAAPDDPSSPFKQNQQLSGVSALLEYNPETQLNPLGNLRPLPTSTEPKFSSQDRLHPDNGVGKFRYVIQMSVPDDNGVDFLWRCIGVKEFNGQAKKLCGWTVEQITPGTPALTTGKDYTGVFSMSDLSFVPAPLSDVDGCPD